MNTLAPELRALIIILRSTGPVISTRRSSGRPEEAHLPVAVADVLRLGQEVRQRARVELALPLGPEPSSSRGRGPSSR